jgi:hypothetical protein
MSRNQNSLLSVAFPLPIFLIPLASLILGKFDVVHNHIKDKRIPNSYPQLQGKIEAYNKIVKSEFLALEDILNVDDGK